MRIQTVADIEQVLEALRAMKFDPEAAHGEEDDLYVATLEAIAEGSNIDPPAQIARKALETRAIVTERWYA